MNVTFQTPVPHGSVAAIPSKSEAHRALICAALCDGVTDIVCPSVSDDIRATVSVLSALGADISYQKGIFSVKPPRTYPKYCEADSGECAATLRMTSLLCASLCPEIKLHMGKRLSQRPNEEIVRQLTSHGCKAEYSDTLTVTGLFTGGECVSYGNISSQYSSGLLFALAVCGGVLTQKGETKSKPYLSMTEKILRLFGCDITVNNQTYRVKKSLPLHSCGTYTVGGDWSDAAVFLVMGAIGKYPVTVTGLDINSIQGDRVIAEFLCRMGCRVETSGGSVTTYPSELKAIEADVSQCPDLTPALAVAACKAKGTSRLLGVSALAYKESDRISSLCSMINSLGGSAVSDRDSIQVLGTEMKGGCVKSQQDHRIAMAAAAASVICKESVTIEGFECVAKSHPSFEEDMRRLCI